MATASKKLRKLNPSQRRFAQEYLKDQNATQAYLRVYGGSDKCAGASGTRLLENVKVRTLVERGLARLADKADITAERNLKRIAEMAYHTKKIKPSDVLKACELIGKTFGQFRDVSESKVTATLAVVDKEEAKRIMDELEREC